MVDLLVAVLRADHRLIEHLDIVQALARVRPAVAASRLSASAVR